MSKLKPPFTYFGGKSRVGDIIWSHFGEIDHYIEPFCGSAAVLFARPIDCPKATIETLNDADCYLSNFWRSIKFDAEAVANYADFPVSEADLHSRHQWLVNQLSFREKILTDPMFFDAKIAGWWAWGKACWIGGEWCRPTARVHRRRPNLGRNGLHRKVAHLAESKQDFSDDLYEYLEAIAQRLRYTNICCGDWRRVLTPACFSKHKTVGIFLDPPYDHTIRDSSIYSIDNPSLSGDVREWAIANGANPKLKIILCGYEGEHEMPDDWRIASWEGLRGYAKAENGNRKKERLWISPACN